MIYYYSPTTNSFFPLELREVYEEAGSWPADGFEVSDEVYAEFGVGPVPPGKIRAAVNGVPAWVDVPPPVDEVTPEEIDIRVLQLLDAAARSHDFVNFADALTYIGDDDSPEDAEIAAALRSWRGAVRAVIKVIKTAPGPYAWADILEALPPAP